MPADAASYDERFRQADGESEREKEREEERVSWGFIGDGWHGEGVRVWRGMVRWKARRASC
jgi:hypothetical protein